MLEHGRFEANASKGAGLCANDGGCFSDVNDADASSPLKNKEKKFSQVCELVLKL
jgi:hypothetical protein